MAFIERVNSWKHFFVGQFKWPQCLLNKSQSVRNGREFADREKKTVIP